MISGTTSETSNSFAASLHFSSSPPSSKHQVEDSDADAGKVEEMSTSTKVSSLMVGKSESQTTGNSRKRSALPGEKESKQMKRLLRNRVSAQQARERKKVYMTDLETKTNELEQKNAELLEKVSTLQRENFMLRQIVKNTTLQNNRIASAGGAQTSET